MTDAIKQNVAMRGDYFFRYGGNDHYIMIEKMEVHGEQPNNVDNVVVFGLKGEAEPEMSEEEANVKSENIAQEMSDVEAENVGPEMSENQVENVGEQMSEEEVNVKSENIVPEMSESENVNVEENVSANISDNIDNANVRPDIKSGDMINEPETLPDTETIAEENIIEDIATPQPTSASLGSNVDSPLAPPAASLSKGGRTRSRIRGRKNALRKSKKRSA
jgi:hypothetical protein